jgi:signal transduction histidine kinase
VSVEIDGSVGDLPVITVDRRALSQIFLNLLSNAVKCTPAGGSVKLEGTVVKHDICPTISDTGIGIAPEETAPSRRYGGVGSGLALSRSLVELHDGTLEISSTLGIGTTVRIALPLRPTTQMSP